MARPKISQIEQIQWSCLSREQWRAISVVTITKPSSRDGGGDENRTGTPYDPRMGEQRNHTACGTCNLPNTECPGHFGTIELPFPVYNRIFTNVVLKILQAVCICCARPRMLSEHIFMHGISIHKGFSKLKALVKKCKNIKRCPHPECGEALVEFSEPNKKRSECGVLYYLSVDKDGTIKREEFSAATAFSVLSRITDEDLKVIGFNENLIPHKSYTDPHNFSTEHCYHIHQFRPESMIFTILPVLPPLARPWVVSEGENGEKKDDDLTDKYNSIIKSIILWNNLNENNSKNDQRRIVCRRGTTKSKSDLEKIIQEHIWTLIDNKGEKSKLSSGGRAHRSLVCRLKGKGGRVQSNVGGKRCDFSARTVIVGGGIRLKNDELGVPEEIAATLTKPIFVGPWNLDETQELVKLGRINCVLRKGKKIKLIEFKDHGKFFHLQNGDIAERQLQDGDIVFFNRQPTLRIESMMSFRVKIVPGMAFMLGLCWTRSFNADFDGDEMNLHVPQSTSAECEIMINARCANHIVSSQSNCPVNGIVQDGLVASYMLTMTWEDGSITMVDKKIVEQIYREVNIDDRRLSDLIKQGQRFYPEYFVKENDRYHFAERIPGSLFISIVFPSNLCYSRKTDVHSDERRSKVVIEDGVLLPSSGPICKKTIGSTSGSIVHVLYKRSPEKALKFLSEIQQLTDRWLPTHGFTMGPADCFAHTSDAVAKTLIETRLKVAEVLRVAETPEKAEAEINGALNSAMAVGPSLAKGNMEKGDRNALNVMRNSGAKGSLINLAQIVAFVGQQNIKGVRIPMTLSHGTRSLPSFLPGDNSPEARGFVEDNYITGLTPQAAFFHAAAGRDGIISSALKSVTGETPIVIIDSFGETKHVLIGDWIDQQLLNAQQYRDLNLKTFPDREMELLDIQSLGIRIPTTDEVGNIEWGLIKNITRHEPGKRLFRIRTYSGRDVTVTESKSLLIWNYDSKQLVQKDSPLVRVGDYVPITNNLIDPDIKMHSINIDGHFNFDFTYENGLFLGLFLAGGTANVYEGWVSIANYAHNINFTQHYLFVKRWFREHKIVARSTKGYSQMLARFLNTFVGVGSERRVPDEVFGASKNFIIGLLKGYASSNGTVTHPQGESVSIRLTSTSPRLIVGLNMLLSRLSLFGRSPFNDLSLFVNADLFLNKVGFRFSSEKNWLPTIPSVQENILFEDCKNDIVLDKIVSIEIIQVEEYIKSYPQYKGKVYDLTVPSTLNFGLANGLHVVDTADTGYVQKRLARKMEDCKVWIDGTVRDANDSIVSFLYGGDGIDPKKLVPVKGLVSPFFVNPLFIAKKLNSDARRKEEVDHSAQPRPLRDIEIDLLLSYISFSKIDSPVIKKATNNAHHTLRQILKSVEIYECKIPNLCVAIRNAYDNSKAQYGTMVGLIATSSIGEPTTQMVLNTFHLAGFKGKDASLGVPRFKEIINVTKSTEQRHPGCAIYFDYPMISQNAKSVIELEKRNRTGSDQNENLIKIAKKNSLALLQSLKKDFEEIRVGDFLEDYELRYIPNDVDPIAGIGSIGLLTYQEYKEEWWVTLAKSLEVKPREYEVRSWVITLKFNVEKLFRRRIELEEIAKAIEEKSNECMMCVSSPNIIGCIELYTKFDEMRNYARNRLEIRVELPSDSATKRKPLFNSDTIDYFLARDVAIDFIRDIQISGIAGISKTYPREDLETHEWVMDTDGINFLNLLAMPGVDTTRTKVDDMHAILSVLGIEAARRFLFLEITRIISFDGTYINPRHISMLVDVMTTKGNLTAASRDGIGRDVGPNAKIMFEKSVDNAMLASAFGEVDQMVSLSSSVMYGKVGLAGPGVVTIKNKERV